MEKITFEKREELDFRANEAYKTLRTNIQFSGDDIKVIALTSCTPNEGKSSVSFNLAISFAESGKRVILIDADLRKSVLVGRYKVGAIDIGLTHYLSGQVELQEVIFDTDIDNLNIIFSGPIAPNPSELLGNENFTDMIKKLQEEYDYIIVDTPPLGSVIDSAIVAKVMDGAILVIENNAISYHFAQNVKKQLEKSNSKILGVVLNKVNMEKNGYYGRYYGKYYGRYYGTYGKEANS
jgi:capsular exopolysaccharide synthesis family protein